jgi:hypothetical protein
VHAHEVKGLLWVCEQQWLAYEWHPPSVHKKHVFNLNCIVYG